MGRQGWDFLSMFMVPRAPLPGEPDSFGPTLNPPAALPLHGYETVLWDSHRPGSSPALLPTWVGQRGPGIKVP